MMFQALPSDDGETAGSPASQDGWVRDLRRIDIVLVGETAAILLSIILLAVFPTEVFSSVMLVDVTIGITLLGVLVARKIESFEMMAVSLLVNCAMAIFVIVGIVMLGYETKVCHDALKLQDDSHVQGCYSDVVGKYDSTSDGTASQVSICVGADVSGAFNGICPDVVHGTKGTAVVILQFMNMSLLLICQCIIGFFEMNYIGSLLTFAYRRNSRH